MPPSSNPEPSLSALKAQLLALSASTDAGFESVEHSGLIAQIKTLAAAVEARTPTPEPLSHLALMDGRWKLLYSSFGLERDTTLRRISFGTLPRDGKIRVSGVYQMVDHLTGQYDNHVEFTAGAKPNDVAGIHITRGRFMPHAENPIRLAITFTGNAALPMEANISEAALRAALGVEADDALAAPIKFEGWSDVTYLDADTRLMRGNAGNLYVLTKV